MICIFLPATFGAKLLYHEDFESYEPAVLETGADGEINGAWFTFRTDIRKTDRFIPEVRLMDGIGVHGSRGLRLHAGLRKLTTSSFFLGVRHLFTADLTGADLDRLRLTAQVRAEVRDLGTGRTMVLPEEFYFGWRIESVRRKRGRGVRQFDATAMGAYRPIGGILSAATSGRELDYGELNLAEGSADYQIVLVLSSCCIGPIYRYGAWDLDLFLDEIRLELLDPGELSVREPAVDPSVKGPVIGPHRRTGLGDSAGRGRFRSGARPLE